MILIITNKDDATADFVAGRLKQSECVRLNSDDLPAAVKIESTESDSAIVIGRRRFAPGDFSGVWYRRPQAITFPGKWDHGECRHAAREYTAGLEGFLALIPEHKWINHPAKNVQAGNKIEQIRRARAMGFRLPRTLITQDPLQLRNFWRRCQGEVIVKPLSFGYIEREPPANDSLIYTNRLRAVDLRRARMINRCPTLFQEQVNKIADIRITVIDGNLQAVEQTATDAGVPRLDIRRDFMQGVKHRAIELPRPIVSKIHRLIRSYKLRFAALDMLRHADLGYVFLEVNPNGQWAWLDALGVSNTRKYLIRALQKD